MAILLDINGIAVFLYPLSFYYYPIITITK